MGPESGLNLSRWAASASTISLAILQAHFCVVGNLVVLSFVTEWSLGQDLQRQCTTVVLSLANVIDGLHHSQSFIFLGFFGSGVHTVFGCWNLCTNHDVFHLSFMRCRMPHTEPIVIFSVQSLIYVGDKLAQREPGPHMPCPEESGVVKARQSFRVGGSTASPGLDRASQYSIGAIAPVGQKESGPSIEGVDILFRGRSFMAAVCRVWFGGNNSAYQRTNSEREYLGGFQLANRGSRAAHMASCTVLHNMPK
jgi:hypothetical protein